MTDVLVVDDSQFIRTVVGNALADAGYTVETAASGEEAVEHARRDDPDVVTMDVEMPGMGGIEAVERIMATDPTPILMLSAYTNRGTEATLDALERGALDILQKPDGTDGRNVGHLTADVVERVDELSAATVSTLALARATAAVNATERQRVAAGTASEDAIGVNGGTTADTPKPRTGTHTSTPSTSTPGGPADRSEIAVERPVAGVPTVIIGASTGGPKIIERIASTLPLELGARIIIVQHMPADFTARLAARLDTVSEYAVSEASDGDLLEAGEIVVAKGGHHLRVTGVEDDALVVSLDDGPRVHGVRPAIDVTMETAAEVVTGLGTLCGVALTGMGRDGAAGIEAIAEVGGHTIAQDEATSPVFGIPQQAIATGRIDETVPAPALPERIVTACYEEGEHDD